MKGVDEHMNKELKIDSGILQFIPKGAYYEGKDEQFAAVSRMWSALFSFDRVLFSLLMILKGTGFSKGAMSHILLSNPMLPDERALIPSGFTLDYETRIIEYALSKEKTPRALRNLLMLAGGERFGRVNNARTRKIILAYIFERDSTSLDYLAVNYKQKLATLIRHALGIQTLNQILNGDKTMYDYWIGRYNSRALPVLLFLFGKPMPKDQSYQNYPMIGKYQVLQNAAKAGDLETFKANMGGYPSFPQRTLMGFRNTYKLDIDRGEIFDKGAMSKRDKLQSATAAKRSGAKTFKVDYTNQDLHDLWKAYYQKLSIDDSDDLLDISEAISNQQERIDKIDFGPTAVIADFSHSMYGSDTRPLNPIITSLSIISTIQNIKSVSYVGGEYKALGSFGTLFPAGATDIATAFVKALKDEPETILIISDGYENSPKGMFEHAYNHFKKMGMRMNVIHVNPVFSADAKSGSIRRLAADIEPLPVENYKYLETEFIFRKMIDHRDMVKNLLVKKYNKLIGA